MNEAGQRRGAGVAGFQRVPEAELESALAESGSTCRLRMSYQRFQLARSDVRCLNISITPGACVVVMGDLILSGWLSVAEASALLVLGRLEAQDISIDEAEVHVGRLAARRVAWLSGGSDALYSIGAVIAPALIAPAEVTNRTRSEFRVHFDPDDPALAAVAARLSGRRLVRGVGSELFRALRDGAAPERLRT